MRKLLCYLKAVPLFVTSGVWCPHIYIEDSREEKIIITTENSFRVSDNFIHRDNETVHPKATLIRYKCKYCGCEDLSWYDREPYTIHKFET